jgi:hypothetical protein
MSTTAGERYRNSITAAGVFYSVLIGFSLQDLLVVELQDPVLDQNRFVLFLVCTFPFLRILLGSANHLSIEYLNRTPDKRTGTRLLFDLSSLTLFGLIAAAICHTDNIYWFFILHAVFLLLGAIWGFVVAATRRRMLSEWPIWIVINLLSGVPLAAFGFTIDRWTAGDPITGYRWTLIVLAACNALALLLDFFVQLAALNRDGGTESTTTGKTG